MKIVDFYSLPRSIQDRFVGAVVSGFPPAPLALAKGATPAKLVWLGGAGASFVLLVVVARLGYGGLDSGLSLQGVVLLVIYAALVFGIAFGVVMAFAQLVRERALPYPSGVYLFPAYVLDARSDRFRIYPIEELASADLAGPAAVRLSFAGGAAFTLPVAPGSGPVVVNEVHAARARTLEARAKEDQSSLVAVDPLHNPRFSSPVGPRESHKRALPPWGKLGWAVAAAAAVVVGPALWAVRNAGSDAKMYARAIQADDVASYRAYLERGRAHVDEIKKTRLPRAELREVEKGGDVVALLAFQKASASTAIGPEIQRAVHDAMLSELDKAKAKNTLAALDAFAKTFPNHGVDKELGVAKDALFARALDTYRTHAPARRDETVDAFVVRLFDWAKTHGGRVEVRFRRKASASLGRADAFVAKNRNFMGEISYPSHYFDEKRTKAREAELGPKVAERLDSGLGEELFDVVVGDPLGPDDPLDFKVPTLVLSHAAEWSGNSFPGTRPRGIYVGILFPLEAQFILPGAKPLKTKADITKWPALSSLKDADPMPQPGQAEEKLYDQMARDALLGIAKKALGQLFKEPFEKVALPAGTTQ